MDCAESNEPSNTDLLRKARPFMKWAGGKTQLIPELLKRVPVRYERYVEPFLGGGALFFALNPRESALSDINQELVRTFQVVRDEVESLITILAKYSYDKEEYYRVRSLDRKEQFEELSQVEKSARMIYLNKTCFNGLYRVNSKGQFNVPFGKYTNPKILDAENLRRCSDALRETKLHTQEFEEILNQIDRGDFIYLDPPYHPLTQTSNFTAYHQEGFGEASQRRLSEVCDEIHRIGAKFMLSNSDTPLIHELYQNYNIERVAASRAINSKGKKRGKLSELLVRNYL